MPKNVMKLLKPSPHRARNDFDLSHRHVYMANYGELLPSTCIETVPGDHIVMHASDLIRAIPMVTSPFVRAKQHIDVWFVPYKDLWHNFDSFITQKSQQVSSALKDAKYCPHMNLYTLWNIAGGSGTDIVGMPYNAGAKKLLNLLGYGSVQVGSSTSDAVDVNPFRLQAYNYIWYNEYRQKYYDDGTNMFNSGVGELDVAQLWNNDLLSCDTVANSDLLSALSSPAACGIKAIMQMRYRTWKKDLFTGLLPSTQFGAVSTVDGLTDTDINRWKNWNGTAMTPSASVYSNGTGVNLYVDGTGVGHTHTTSFDVLTLRRSEAVQIWRENALRAGNRVADNMMAHYGIESDFRDHRPTYLGSVSSP